MSRETDEVERILRGDPPISADLESLRAANEDAAIGAVFARNADVLKLTRPSAGNKFVNAGYGAPNINSTPNATSKEEWVESTLAGPRTLKVGRKSFSIPRDAIVKRAGRSHTAWVKTSDGRTHILSELGELKQTPTEQRSLRFDLL